MKVFRYLNVLAITMLSLAAMVGGLYFFLVPSKEALQESLATDSRKVLQNPDKASKTLESESADRSPAPEETVEASPERKTSDDADAPTEPIPETVAAKPPEPSQQEENGPPDLDDPDVLKRIVAVAIDRDRLRSRRVKRSKMDVLYDGDKPFTGWVKRTWSRTGELKELGFCREGLADGLWLEWEKDGAKRASGAYQAGEKHGIWTHWRQNGGRSKEYRYELGKKKRL
tara:strand:+ start:3742 stop:4428 length:687 start_codon:yes stop_codon:yes gene_type:complete